MNIIVPVPKSEIDHFWDEPPPGSIEWWTLPRRPTKLNVGDYIYFAIAGSIVGRARVDELMVREDLVCSATGRHWKGCHVMWRSEDFQRTSVPGFHLKQTRGFSYLQ